MQRGVIYRLGFALGAVAWSPLNFRAAQECCPSSLQSSYASFPRISACCLTWNKQFEVWCSIKIFRFIFPVSLSRSLSPESLGATDVGAGQSTLGGGISGCRRDRRVKSLKNDQRRRRVWGKVPFQGSCTTNATEVTTTICIHPMLFRHDNS